LPKISFFYEKFRLFLPKISFFVPKISFVFAKNFVFLTTILFSSRKFHFCANHYICFFAKDLVFLLEISLFTKNSFSWQTFFFAKRFVFRHKILFFAKHFVFSPKISFLKMIDNF